MASNNSTTSKGSRGALIVVEGLDRAGKSTQCASLVKSLEERDVPVRYKRFPDRTTPIGKTIDQYLKGEIHQEDHVIHLLFSANRWEAAEQIRRDIESGITYVIDRYYYSGCVYSAAKDIPGLDLEWAWGPEVGLLRPDLCLFLDISTQEAAERGGWGGEAYETSQMQKRVRTLFAELFHHTDPRDFVRIDAGRSEIQVSESIIQAVDQYMKRIQDLPNDQKRLRSALPFGQERSQTGQS